MEETLQEIEEKANLDFSFSKPSDLSPPRSPTASKRNVLLSPPSKVGSRLQVNQFSATGELPMIVIKKPTAEIKNEIIFSHND